jgi:putative ABC transport system permease protein
LLGVSPEAGLLDNGWIVSDEFAQRQFGGASQALGRMMLVEAGGYGQEPRPIGAVMPPGFRFPASVDVWSVYGKGPAASNSTYTGRLVQAVARLQPGVTIQQARTELQAIEDGLSLPEPKANAGWRVEVVPLRQAIVGNVRPALLALYGAAALVLLIACVNVVNLLLARATSRRREFAVRQALGATRGRLLRQALVESLTLATIGGAAGVALAAATVPVLVSLAPAGLPRVEEIRLDPLAIIVTVVLVLAVGVLLGLSTGRPGIGPTWLRAQTTSTAGRRTGRRALVAAEVALSLVLLTGATLLARSFVALMDVNPGFDASHVLAVRVRHPVLKAGEERLKQYPYPRFARVTRELLGRVRELPGVEQAGGVTYAPLTQDALHGYAQLAPGPIVASPETLDSAPIVSTPRWPAVVRQVTTRFFETLRIPVLAGQTFTDADAYDAASLGNYRAPRPPGVAVVSRSFVDAYFPGENPIGRFIVVERGAGGQPSARIVGIVGDVHFEALAVPAGPTVYTPYSQEPMDGLVLLARTSGPPAALAASVREVIRSFGTSLAAEDARTLEDVVNSSVAGPRFDALLVGLFAGLGLVLAAVGLYGVLAFLVGERTVEIGVRMAVGAEPGQVVGLVVRQGLGMTAAGFVVGLAAALLAGHSLRSLLFGVSPLDPLTLAVACTVLAIAGAAACYLPARRAARVDPMVALRAE